MPTKRDRPSDRPCLDSRGQIRVRDIAFRVNSVSGARNRGRQPSLPEPGLNPGDPLAKCQHSLAGLVTDHTWDPGDKSRFLGLGLTHPIGVDTEGGTKGG